VTTKLRAIPVHQSHSVYMFFIQTSARKKLRTTRYNSIVDPNFCRCRPLAPSTDYHFHRFVTSARLDAVSVCMHMRRHDSTSTSNTKSAITVVLSDPEVLSTYIQVWRQCKQFEKILACNHCVCTQAASTYWGFKVTTFFEVEYLKNGAS